MADSSRLAEAIAAYHRHDFAQAVAQFRPLAEAGVATAQAWLGWLTGEGLGVEKDLAAARRWHLQAAEQGEPWAAYNLGTIYDYGIGLRRDITEAVRWYRLAAVRGQSAAQFDLGWLSREGDGLPRDLIEAYVWFSLAAEGGEDDALGEVNAIAARLSPEERRRADRLLVERCGEIERNTLIPGQSNPGVD